jgi:glutathione synthase/RimK-type ligase-like ATP-grasp enzyme
MKTKSIIIASHDKDQSALFLMKRLVEQKQDVHLINFGDFPAAVSGTLLFEKDATIGLRTSSGVQLDQDSIKSIWWRRPQGPIKNPQTSPLHKYVQNESDITLSCLMGLFNDVLWVSEPEATRIANRKPLQITLARKLGFNVPETCISNDPEQVKGFISRHYEVPLIMKAVGSSFVRLTDDVTQPTENKAIYTKILDKNLLLKNLARVANCPFILQEAVIKDSDIRITVVGESVFSVEIRIERNINENNLDWRHHDVERKYAIHKLPKNIERMCVRLVRELNLKFGCIDMGFSNKNGYSFFEINPQGQWMPSEQLVGHPISSTLANLLACGK